MTDPRFPIGQYAHEGEITAAQIQEWIARIESLPGRMREVVEGLSDDQFAFRYRDGGWTIRQVVHHVPDSHLNAYVRFKWTLTEDEPRIKGYHEDRWAELGDGPAVDAATNLDFLELLHRKWVALVRSMSREDLARRFVHPETETSIELAWMLGMYAWHGDHHLAHVRAALERGRT